jgi:hypothetical protein
MGKNKSTYKTLVGKPGRRTSLETARDRFRRIIILKWNLKT